MFNLNNKELSSLAKFTCPLIGCSFCRMYTSEKRCKSIQAYNTLKDRGFTMEQILEGDIDDV